MSSVLRLFNHIFFLEFSLDLVLLLEELSLLLFMSRVVKDVVLFIGVPGDKVFFGGVGSCDLFAALPVGVEGFGVFV